LYQQLRMGCRELNAMRRTMRAPLIFALAPALLGCTCMADDNSLHEDLTERIIACAIAA